MEFQKTVCFDFDGVCATYDTWKGVDVFGDPIPETANLVRLLRIAKYRCILWTTRKMTPALLEWLAHHNFIFDSINACDHNPPDTSNKPIAELYIDDRGFRFDPSIPITSSSAVLKMLGVEFDSNCNPRKAIEAGGCPHCGYYCTGKTVFCTPPIQKGKP